MFDPKMLEELQKKKDVAQKFDQEKIRYDLIPPEVEKALAEVLTFGAKKYSERNWEEGLDWNRVYRAAKGHLNDWWAGKFKDEESGLSHTKHALACVAFLVTYEERGIKPETHPHYNVKPTFVNCRFASTPWGVIKID